MSKPKAVLLDLDDTLIAFDRGLNIDGCWLTACEAVQARLSGIAPSALVPVIRARARHFWHDPGRHQWGRLHLDEARQQIVNQALAEVGIYDKALAVDIVQAYVREREAVIHPFPGAFETVEILRQEGIKLALITNGDALTQRRKVTRFNLAPLFDVVLIEGEFGYGKPHEAVYLEALQQLEVSAADTWMVGDNFEWEVAGPMQHGITGIWVDHSGHGLPPTATVQPYAVIQSITELPTLVTEAATVNA